MAVEPGQNHVASASAKQADHRRPEGPSHLVVSRQCPNPVSQASSRSSLCIRRGRAIVAPVDSHLEVQNLERHVTAEVKAYETLLRHRGYSAEHIAEAVGVMYDSDTELLVDKNAIQEMMFRQQISERRQVFRYSIVNESDTDADDDWS
uniref:Uncharacterized protein n=1 Tax=Spongospora subterranea TaxID=70186 RepID=A0A0H5RQ44_9EUKA|eukprot:CRZ10824.1 hypothetical protein [Spongospora subterranea]